MKIRIEIIASDPKEMKVISANRIECENSEQLKISDWLINTGNNLMKILEKET